MPRHLQFQPTSNPLARIDSPKSGAGKGTFYAIAKRLQATIPARGTGPRGSWPAERANDHSFLDLVQIRRNAPLFERWGLLEESLHVVLSRGQPLE